MAKIATVEEWHEMLRDAHCTTCKMAEPLTCKYCRVTLAIEKGRDKS